MNPEFVLEVLIKFSQIRHCAAVSLESLFPSLKLRNNSSEISVYIYTHIDIHMYLPLSVYPLFLFSLSLSPSLSPSLFSSLHISFGRLFS